MPSSPEKIEEAIQDAMIPGFRNKLLARGQARALVWNNGILPPESPSFSMYLSYELCSYGYALLGLGLRLCESGGDKTIARGAFEHAATALESVTRNGNPNEADRDFNKIIAAACYHLGRFSARAYSLLEPIQNENNNSPIENALALLMLRNFNDLEDLIVSTRNYSFGVEADIISDLDAALHGDQDIDKNADNDLSSIYSGVDKAITDNFLAGLGAFILALEKGAPELVDEAKCLVREGMTACSDLNLVPQWWVHRVAIYLLDDLWAISFHSNLPTLSDEEGAETWNKLRRHYLALLIRRQIAEIDLWPSQLEGARRSVQQSDDLVVSLPTSAGKTRIAELCILRCLAAGNRVIFVTPLRALSAQTETGLQKTFAPLGKTVSTLYGSIGATPVDQEMVRERDIVVATPEKLDFAIRNDPSLIDDVGLVVLDEGHMIGLTEREVRYEVQIQRLLRRDDAENRRIVCLSAILPDNEQIDDFANWLRRDRDGDIIKQDWRPTRLRYGEVIWQGRTAKLEFRVSDEAPYVGNFLESFVPPIGRRQTPFPRDLGELCVATAWRLVDEGQSVLIYCPVRDHVEPFANRITDLHKRGALTSQLRSESSSLETALVIGAEWLGEDHPILECLRLGVGIHHGALPTPLRREIERLLRTNVLKIVISSPTLAQGLNLSATAIIMHSLYRNREKIDASEFRNVIGRAGRAYADIEGLVLYPIFDKHQHRRAKWRSLVEDETSREMESGLIRLVITLLQRMYKRLNNPSKQQFEEYVLNNSAAWEFPVLKGETSEESERQKTNWSNYLARLDAAVLSLLGSQEVREDEIAEKLDEVLNSSLWERRLRQRKENVADLLRSGLISRTQHIWANSTATQRKGYFLAGVGLEAGHALDAIAKDANDLIVQANSSIANNEYESAIYAIRSLASRVFEIEPFIPRKLPENWTDILDTWLRGRPIVDVAGENKQDALQFIEHGLVYCLPWAMEALRVRGIANGDEIGDGLTLEDFELGYAVSAVETGTLLISAAVLIKAGFDSRLAAIKSVEDTCADFDGHIGLKAWLNSDLIARLSQKSDWPTQETADLWTAFRESFTPEENKQWKEENWNINVSWTETAPDPGRHVRLTQDPSSRQVLVLSETGAYLGEVQDSLNPERQGSTLGSVLADQSGVSINYIGPQDLWLN